MVKFKTVCFAIAIFCCGLRLSNADHQNQTNKVQRLTNVSFPDTLVCPSDDVSICWPKCCFANQFFNVNRSSCVLASKTAAILYDPDVFSIK